MDSRRQCSQRSGYEQRSDRRDFGARLFISYIAVRSVDLRIPVHAFVF
jgi:hypothetical protein